MSQNHGVTKRNRRKVSKSRVTQSAKRIAGTMAHLRFLASKEEFDAALREDYKRETGRDLDEPIGMFDEVTVQEG